MSQEPLRVEFRVDLGKRPPAPKPEPVVKAEWQRVDRAARRARNLALAYWIDHLIRTGQLADLAAVARMCSLSRAGVSNLMSLLHLQICEQEAMILVREEPVKPLRQADAQIP